MGDIAETLPRFIPPHNSQSYDRPVPALISHAAKLTFVAYAVFIAYESLVPAGAVGSMRHMDKVVHAGAYFVFSALLMIALTRLSLKAVFLISFAFGAAVELMQGVMDIGRTVSYGDLIANAFGAALAVALSCLVIRILK